MKDLQLIKAFASVWLADTTLQNYKLSSTRIPPNTKTQTTLFPYGLIECGLIPGSRKFDSNNQISEYSIKITFYGGYVSQTTTQALNDAADRMEAIYNFALGLPVDGAYVLQVIPQEEDPFLDKDDYYGADVRYIVTKWKVRLNETRIQITDNV